MSFTNLTISGNTYPSYASVEEADVYLAADADLHVTWEKLDVDDKSRRLVSATRRLDTLCWKGTQTNHEQETSWPRKGIEGVEDDVIPSDLEKACILLAGDHFIPLGGTRSGVDFNVGSVQSEQVGPKTIVYFSPETDQLTYNLKNPGDGLVIPYDILVFIIQWIEKTTAEKTTTIAAPRLYRRSV